MLEVGAGSGYNAAVMAEIVGREGRVITVYGILSWRNGGQEGGETGYDNVTVVVGDGSVGYPEEAPYDRIRDGGASLPGALLTS